MAIARNQTWSSRELFVCEARNSLPRVSLRNGESEWDSRGRSIELSQQADGWLAQHGYDRRGQSRGRNGSGPARQP
jgi:hypothetical protein